MDEGLFPWCRLLSWVAKSDGLIQAHKGHTGAYSGSGLPDSGKRRSSLHCLADTWFHGRSQFGGSPVGEDAQLVTPVTSREVAAAAAIGEQLSELMKELVGHPVSQFIAIVDGLELVKVQEKDATFGMSFHRPLHGIYEGFLLI